MSGVLSLRGEVVTVLDFRVILGLGKTDCTKRTRNVIVHAGGERIGLLVDRVADVVQLSTADLLPPPANLSSTKSTVFHSRLSHGKRIAIAGRRGHGHRGSGDRPA